MISDFFCKMFPNEDTRAVMWVLSLIAFVIAVITVSIVVYNIYLIR